ncbi:MAG: PhoPQ-activated protein PqaA family protein, partial [Chthoniobacteraceae bacterium]
TAAIAEKDVFQPKKVLTTGGSKRGVATAASCVADDRITAMMPVVAPIIDSPGGPYVEGTMDPKLTKMDDDFLAAMQSEVGRTAMLGRQKARSDERLTLDSVKAAGWSDAEIKAASSLAWEVCRTTNYLDALKKRGVDIFYCEGSNDNVSPGLIELGEKFPQLPVYIMPGGQHGGAKEAGFTKPVASQPDVDENLYAFAMHHFFGTRRLVGSPRLTVTPEQGTHRCAVTVTFPDGTEPQANDLFWSVNRHPDYTFLMEFDEWKSAPLRKTSSGSYKGEVTLDGDVKTVDFISVHRHTEAGITLTVSSHEIRMHP